MSLFYKAYKAKEELENHAIEASSLKLCYLFNIQQKYNIGRCL